MATVSKAAAPVHMTRTRSTAQQARRAFEEDLEAIRQRLQRSRSHSLQRSSLASTIESSQDSTTGAAYATGFISSVDEAYSASTSATSETSAGDLPELEKAVTNGSSAIALLNRQRSLELQRRREAFENCLTRLEILMGPFKDGWKEERAVCLEEVWLKEYLQQDEELENSNAPLMWEEASRTNGCSTSMMEIGVMTPIKVDNDYVRLTKEEEINACSGTDATKSASTPSPSTASTTSRLPVSTARHSAKRPCVWL